MNLKTTIKSMVAAAVAVFCSGNVSAQDLLANQAPVDKKIKAVDSVALHHLYELEAMGEPSSDLYAEWENVYAHREGAVPDSFRINLREFCMPTTNRVVTSNFGGRWGRQHKGIDVKVYVGDTIRAAFSGKVRMVRNQGARRGYGKYIVIRHYNGLETIYGHLSKQLVVEDQEVRAGDVIGLGGNTGRSTGSHLHFETRLCGLAINPAIMFDFHNQDVVADEYMFRKSRYQNESIVANRLRGAGVKSVLGKVSEDDEMLASVTEETAPARETKLHKVVKGETLAAIARKRGTTINELCRLNHITTKSKLMPGQILKYSK